MQDNGYSIIFRQIHLYRFVRDEYTMKYSPCESVFGRTILLFEIVSKRPTRI